VIICGTYIEHFGTAIITERMTKYKM
jgi:hypothetical protein